jgi:transcriptional regulator with XRE-family HTH domain
VAKSIYSGEQQKLQELLRQARANAALTQVGLANRLRRPQSFVSKYESGERRLDLVELRQVCGGLGISLADFARKFDQAVKSSKQRQQKHVRDGV